MFNDEVDKEPIRIITKYFTKLEILEIYIGRNHINGNMFDNKFTNTGVTSKQIGDVRRIIQKYTDFPKDPFTHKTAFLNRYDMDGYTEVDYKHEKGNPPLPFGTFVLVRNDEPARVLDP